MKILLRMFSLGMLFSLFCQLAYAGLEPKVLGFKQITNLSSAAPSSDNTLLLNNLNPNLGVWICLYYVGLKQGDSREAYHQLALQSDDLLLSSNPQQIKLIADNLPSPQDFALDENDDVADLLDSQLDVTIPSLVLPIDFNRKKIRVYSTTTDYTQSIDADGTLKLSLVSQAQQDFKPLALYVIVGQGDQPEELSSLTSVNALMPGDPGAKKAHQMAMREAFDPKLKLLLMIVAFCGLLYMYKNK